MRVISNIFERMILMREEIIKKLEDNVVYQLDNVNSLAIGGELHQNAIEDIATTISTIQDIEKAEREVLAAKQEFKRDTIIKSLEAGVAVGTLGATVASLISREKWIKAGFELETTGTFTVQTLKTIFNSMFKK